MDFFSKRHVYPMILALFMVCIILALTLTARHRNQAMRAQLHQLRQELLGIETKSRDYEAEIQALQQDHTYVEYLLRSKMGYGRKGDNIFVVPASSENR